MVTDVLICGAGPVGMTMASELLRFGLNVRIVDAAPARTDKSKALVLWSRSIELLEPSGLSERFVLAGGARVSTAEFAEGQWLIGAFNFGDLESDYPYALMIPQTQTERVLETHLQAEGAAVERDVRLVAFSQDADGVTASLAHADGSTETARARWLLGCDGAHSFVRHGLGLQFEGMTEPVEWALADVFLPDAVAGDRLQMDLHPAGILALFPMGGHRFRLIVDAGPAKPGAGEFTLADLQTMIDARGRPDLKARDPVWLSRFKINERKVADYRVGRVFLAGDAAHIHSPAGGQGMNTGMQDAFNLAWKLALVAKGAASDALLDSYSSERSGIGDRVLRNAGFVTKVASFRNPILRKARNLALGWALDMPFAQRRVARMLSELDIAYPQSPLSVGGKSVLRKGLKPGMRVDPRSTRLRQSEIGASGKFHVVGAKTEISALEGQFPALVGAGTLSQSGLWLIRPDGYAGFAGGAGDLAKAVEYLATISA
jgi:2-polyprenyl-6-methoxyphenol hydroxylase-like FAD-dependent oxidoreductase